MHVLINKKLGKLAEIAFHGFIVNSLSNNTWYLLRLCICDSLWDIKDIRDICNIKDIWDIKDNEDIKDIGDIKGIGDIKDIVDKMK